jgi:hypothetical protein
MSFRSERQRERERERKVLLFLEGSGGCEEMIREKGVRGFQKAKERAIERSGKRANEGGAHQKRD